MWARQLFRRIKDPMELFQDKAPHILKSPEAKKIIRNYNKVGKVLLEFEVLYHREWIRQIDCIRAGTTRMKKISTAALQAGIYCFAIMTAIGVDVGMILE